MENGENAAAASPVRGFSPSARVAGTLHLAGSKSHAQRALLAAAAAAGTTRIAGVPPAEDVVACVRAIRALGARVEGGADGDLRVTGRPPSAGGFTPRAALDVGESGTLARLVTALGAFGTRSGAELVIEARGTLRGRSSPPLFAALRRAGVTTEPGDAVAWPVRLRGMPLPESGARLVLSRPVSSQEVSGLLLACAAAEGRQELRVEGPIPSLPYVELTRRVLRDFGVDLECDEARASFRVPGVLRAPNTTLALEPDASSAAVALAAACLSGGEVRVPGLGRASLQGDVRIVEHLASFGCDARAEDDALVAAGRPSRGASLDLAGEPDLAPVLAIVAARAALDGAPSELTGLGTLRGKESDRVAVLAQGLRAAGFRVDAGDDRLRVLTLDPAAVDAGVELRLDPRGDHRMAFAFALLGLVRPGVRVVDADCVAKSWPSFWDDLDRLIG